MTGDGSAGPFDLDARMEEIVGRPQRVEPVELEALSEEQLALIMKVRGAIHSREVTHMPEFFLTAVKHPRLFRCQMETGTVLFQGAISARERELAVLRIAWLCGAPYEWGEHVDISKRYGVSPEEVERATRGSTAPGWSDHDAAILAGVEELLDNKMVSDATWNTLARSWTEEQLMEFPMLVGAYVSTAFQQNTLRMRLEAVNPGLKHR